LLAEIIRLAGRYDVPSHYLTMVLHGARRDLDGHAIETVEELRHYALLVAGSVGVVMAHILGGRSEAALSAASELGIAMQLTNVLRDVGEDLRRGRIYLPRTELERAGCPIETLQTYTVTPGFRRVVRLLATQARDGYQRGIAGIHYLDPSARFAISLAATLYAGILDEIELHDFDVFRHRAHLGMKEKCTAAARAYIQYRRLPAV